MKFIVVEGSAEVRDSLCYALLTFGIKAVPVAGRSEALETVRSDARIEGAIIDIDSRQVEGMQLIQELRGAEDLRRVRIVVHTVRSSRDLVVGMVEQGVVGYLLKPYNEGELPRKFRPIYERLVDHNTQRRHIRVRPDPEELLRLHFRLPGQRGLISGRIVDISVGGLAAELFHPPAATAIVPGLRIPSVQFTMAGKQFGPAAVVVLYKQGILALRFLSLPPGEQTALAKYVFKRISA